MCIAKARVVKCGHTVGYEILLPCGNYVANGPPCAAWDERLINKVFLKDRPVCVGCRWKKEKKICRRYVDAEREMVRSPGGIHGASAKEVWEKRLAVGERMMRDVGGLDREGGGESFGARGGVVSAFV